ncbi:MAG: hypothetical protein ACREKE_09935 [bacterium]
MAEALNGTLNRIGGAATHALKWTTSTLKTSAAVLVGIILGLVVAFLLAWYGSRAGADAIRHNVWNRVWAVQDRQEAMADQVLALEPLLKRFGALRHTDVFADVERERSELAGDASLKGKLTHEQWLEEALLRSERVWGQSRRHRALALYEPWQAYGRLWELQMRQLVVEERGLKESTYELNGLLYTWPLSVLLAHRTLGSFSGSLLSDAGNGALFVARVGLDWTGYGLRRLAALAGHEAPPPKPQWTLFKHPVRTPADTRPYIEPLPQLVFLADAPLPQGDYSEVQYTREVPADYADVKRGDDQPVLENRKAPAAYAAPLLKPQMTVTYSAPN